jgi:hypothetical protein
MPVNDSSLSETLSLHQKFIQWSWTWLLLIWIILGERVLAHGNGFQVFLYVVGILGGLCANLLIFRKRAVVDEAVTNSLVQPTSQNTWGSI